MQLRTFMPALALGAAFTLLAGAASAQQIYKWKDANGVTHFSQSPPASSTQYSKLKLTGQPDVAAPNPAASSDADADADNAQASAQAAGNARAGGGTQADTPANRAALCKQIASNITVLQGKAPVVAATSSGDQSVMSDNAREQQLATARAQQAQYCQSKGG